MTKIENEINEILSKVLDGKDLDQKQSYSILDHVANGRVSALKIAALLSGLRTKKETSEEITGFVKAMRDHAVKLPLKEDDLKKWSYPIIDTCGTGGDGSRTFNISTLVAIVVAGHGVPVLKHGNRLVSSACGSADLLQALGLKIDLTPEQSVACLKQVGLAFLFAPIYHPAMKHVVPVRKELGVRTVFNLLGPLLHPASIKHQLVGVFSPALQEKLAEVLFKLKLKRFMVVCSDDGMDEASVFAKTKVLQHLSEASGDNGSGAGIVSQIIDPSDYGLMHQESERKNILVNDIEASCKIAKSILAGEKGVARDIVLLNAALALVVANASDDIGKAIEMAAKSIDDRKAQLVIDKMKDFCTKL